MRRKNVKRCYAIVLIFAITLSLFPSTFSIAIKKASLKKKSITMDIGAKSTINIKNRIKKRTYSFKSNKPTTAWVSKAGIVKAKKKGTAVITVREEYKKKGKKISKKIGTVKIIVNVKNKKKNTATPSNSPLPTQQATDKPIEPTATPIEPTASPTPTPPFDVITDWQPPSGYASLKQDVQYGTLKEDSYYSNFTKTTRKCNILLPPNYSEEKEYPVLYLLHGIGGDHNEWVREGGQPRRIIGNLIAEGKAAEMIVVIPNVRARANDSATTDTMNPDNALAFDNFIYDLEGSLMPFIEEKYPVSTKREDTAIAGLSMGGRESLFIGFNRLERFAYIGAFSSAPGLLGSSGQMPAEDLAVKDGNKMPRLVLLCVGTEDWLISSSQEYHQALINNGVHHLWYTMPGGHDFSVWNNGLYNFAKRIFN